MTNYFQKNIINWFKMRLININSWTCCLPMQLMLMIQDARCFENSGTNKYEKYPIFSVN